MATRILLALWSENGFGGMTMAEYIEREKLSAKIDWDNDIEKWTINDDDLCSIPAADAALVKHGRWIVGEMYVFGCPIHCSECGWGSDCADVNKWMNYPGHKFCGSCGARMDGGETP